MVSPVTYVLKRSTLCTSRNIYNFLHQKTVASFLILQSQSFLCSVFFVWLSFLCVYTTTSCLRVCITAEVFTKVQAACVTVLLDHNKPSCLFIVGYNLLVSTHCLLQGLGSTAKNTHSEYCNDRDRPLYNRSSKPTFTFINPSRHGNS